MSTSIAPGMRVICRDAEWLVTRVEPSDQINHHYAVHCVGTDNLVKGHQSIFLTQLDKIIPVDPGKTRLIPDDSSGYNLSKLYLESHLRSMPDVGLEPALDSMGVFDPMNFQIETVKRALKQLRPRLLLADAVGLGKTIQVGMILTELMRRGRADRVLVLAKKSMLTQFQSELWNRFNIPLVRLDSQGIAKLRLRIPANKNPFEIFHRVIISIDTLKNVARFEHFLQDTHWDAVIIDEAHNVAGASVPDKHLSYRLARLLSRKTDSMLLTTATPHNGKKDTFGRLISLLDPSAIPDPDLQEYTAEDIQDFFLMRFKEDIREEAKNMLSDRKVIPPSQTTIPATSAEESVLSLLTIIRSMDNWKKTGKDRLFTDKLSQYGYYKQFLSSPESCLSSLVKRRVELEKEELPDFYIDHLNNLAKGLKNLTLDKTSRFQLLLKQLREIGWDGKPDSPRVIIFTEYRKTQDALTQALADEFGIRFSEKHDDQPKQVISKIHGGTPDVQLMATVEAFATGSSKMRLLIATDVASEGINLHHECHNIIHYDIPWSIIRLVQRNGRIDRLGQTHEPVIRYLLVDTDQGPFKGDKALFERLITKVEEINCLRMSGESLLRLYDPEKEEEFLAQEGFLKGDINILEKASSKADDEVSDLEALISLSKNLGHKEHSQQEQDQEFRQESNSIRLFNSLDFFHTGYRYLREKHQEENHDPRNVYHPIEVEEHLHILTAPADLRRRLGAPDDQGNVIFGSTAIPQEAWPQNNQFRLTDKVDRVELAIKAARQTSGYWASEQLANDQHPILLWITERLLMQMNRGEAPIILSQGLDVGELCFCFIGQVSSKAGTPLVVDAHTISYRPGGEMTTGNLLDVLDRAGFNKLVNTGKTPNLNAATPLVPAAVQTSLEHMATLKEEYLRRGRPLLRKEERRLKKWENQRTGILNEKIRQLGSHHSADKFKRRLQHVNEYLNDRKRWRDIHFTPAATPVTQLVLVIEGTDSLQAR